MSTSLGSCEIVESLEELDSEPKFGEEVGKDRILKLGQKYSIEDDINKLFESYHVRSPTKGLGLSQKGGRDALLKRAMKKPIRACSPPSSGIGITEHASLKQALRGLCITQASEMAAMKRSLKLKPPGLPGASEAGTIKRLYRAVVVEAGESGVPLTEGKGNLVEISLVPENSMSNSCKTPESVMMRKPKALSPSTSSTPACYATIKKSKLAKRFPQNENVPLSTKVEAHKSKTELIQDGALKSTHSSSRVHTCEKVPEVDKIDPAAEVSTNTVEPEKVKKGKLHSTCSLSSSIAGSNTSKTCTSSRLIKPAFTKKNFFKRRASQNPSSASSNSSVCNGEVDKGLESSASGSVCQSQNHNLKNGNDEASQESSSNNLSIEVSSSIADTGASKLDISLNFGNRAKTVITKADERSRSREKGEFSQSSKSSIGDYSTSTSISGESSLSGSSRIGNRPHMSKDLRWEAIRHVHKQHGTLSLRYFKLLKKLGCGDIGTVYLAELTGTNCLFALKVMDNEFLGSKKKMLRAKTEREILQVLDHPFLPTLFAHFTSDKMSCLVMEYCSGGDLHVLRQKQPNRNFSEQAVRFYVAEVLLALEYLHMLGVVYRDLKPENILVREDGHIMLSDFDLSLRCTVSPTLLKSSSAPVSGPTNKTSSSCTDTSCINPFCLHPSWQASCFTPRVLSAAAKTRKLKSDLAAQVIPLPQLVAEPTSARSNSFVGTHEYLAPEIIKGEGHGSAVDWWTYGIFMYELLYGKTPFKGSGNEETLSNVVSQSLKFPESPIVSFHARDLIRRLLIKDPENRSGSVKGAAEIKQHSFFEGLNWALIRCAVPPEQPKFCDVGSGTQTLDSQKKDGAKCKKELKTSTGEDVEFELF